MREPPRPFDPDVTVSRRRLLLLGATASIASACGNTVESAPPDASVGDATPDAGGDALADASLDLARPDAPSDRADAAGDAPERMDAAPDAAPDAVIDRAEVAPDRADVPVDEGVPCGLTDRYLASLQVTAVPSRGGVVDAALRVVVARDAGGLYAMSAVCPHNGCVVAVVSGAATSCPCHGSTFDNNGVRRSGPATRSLIHHPLSVCSGRVYVDPSRSIAVTTRTPAA